MGISKELASKWISTKILLISLKKIWNLGPTKEDFIIKIGYKIMEKDISRMEIYT